MLSSLFRFLTGTESHHCIPNVVCYISIKRPGCVTERLKAHKKYMSFEEKMVCMLAWLSYEGELGYYDW
jgi:hypothetical protein